MPTISLWDSLDPSKSTSVFPKIKDHAVYFFYNIEGDLIYIGKSLCGRLHSRMNAHNNSTDFFNLVDKIKVTLFECEGYCSTYEAYMIGKYVPLFNKDKPNDKLEGKLKIELQEYDKELYTTRLSFDPKLSKTLVKTYCKKYHLKERDLLRLESEFKCLKYNKMQTTGMFLDLDFNKFLTDSSLAASGDG